MATIHNVLAIISKEGVAKIFYAHPIIQKTSTILNNRSIIKGDPRTIVKMSIKTMPSGKRILLTCRPIDTANIKSIQDFIDETGEERMKRAAEAEVVNGFPRIDKFDGVQDAPYLISKYYLPRFRDGELEEGNSEDDEEIESTDGFMDFGGLYLPEITVRTLEAMKSISQTNTASNVLLVGSSGNGKTSLAKGFAKKYGMTFVKVNCSVVRDPEEWFGYREAVEGSTQFVETEFTKAVKAGNAVILLDEINRLEPYLHNSLMPLLDETRTTTIHGNEITVGPNVVFFCTMNLGAGFVGTFLLDSAIKNRMDATVVMQKLSFDREVQLLVDRISIKKEVAVTIIRVLEKIRDAVARHQIEVDVSHRSALKVARIMNTGTVELKEALALVIFNNADSSDQAKLLMDSIIGMKF